MPEIAEVARYVDQLNDKFKGSTLHNVKFIGGRFLKEKQPIIIFPLNNAQFNSKGKFIYWSFDEPVHFFVTLGMTGSFGQKNNYSGIEFQFYKDKIYVSTNFINIYLEYLINDYSDNKINSKDIIHYLSQDIDDNSDIYKYITHIYTHLQVKVKFK